MLLTSSSQVRLLHLQYTFLDGFEFAINTYMGTKLSEKVIRYRKNIKRKMILSMGGKCQDCGYSRCNDALEFHHIDPATKEIGFGKVRSNPKNITKLLNELKKCILLCSICHREVHAGIRAIPDEYTKLDPSVFGWIESSEGFVPMGKETMTNPVKKKSSIRRKFEISSNELAELIATKSLCEIGRMFGVSDNAIRKRAKKFGIL